MWWPWRVFRVLDAPVLRTSDDFLALVAGAYTRPLLSST
jgi:hypothetical protein